MIRCREITGPRTDPCGPPLVNYAACVEKTSSIQESQLHRVPICPCKVQVYTSSSIGIPTCTSLIKSFTAIRRELSDPEENLVVHWGSICWIKQTQEYDQQWFSSVLWKPWTRGLLGKNKTCNIVVIRSCKDIQGGNISQQYLKTKGEWELRQR